MTISPAPLSELIESHLRSPMNRLMGITLVAVEPGEVLLRVDPQDRFRNSLEVMHGGFTATILDSACGMAGNSVVAGGHVCMTAELKVVYLRKIAADTGPLTVIGRVQKSGRQLIFVEGVVKDAAGRDLATATSTLIVLPRAGGQ